MDENKLRAAAHRLVSMPRDRRLDRLRVVDEAAAERNRKQHNFDKVRGEETGGVVVFKLPDLECHRRRRRRCKATLTVQQQQRHCTLVLFVSCLCRGAFTDTVGSSPRLPGTAAAAAAAVVVW